ncbi:HNH endonuclease [Photobacterium piscicola]|uniref:HNH endonuclease n=1 Tax=Photobacterium piscicola TaxID=1378299 RepID=UPI0038D1A193
MSTTIKRQYKEKDVKQLIASAGGRCSYRHEGEICKRLLINNNSVIGEKAHIVAIGRKGARFDSNYPEEQINSYENLIWMCPTHHTMIDKLDDEHIYTTDVLLAMKKAHEKDIEVENYSNGTTLYDTVLHDYSSLSTLFYYVNINKLYSSSIDLPNTFDHDFGELHEMLDLYNSDLGEFHLKDKYLNKLFFKMLNTDRLLSDKVNETFKIEYILNKMKPIEKYSCSLIEGKSLQDIQLVEDYQCDYQEAVDNFLNAIRNRYPELLYAPTYEPII